MSRRVLVVEEGPEFEQTAARALVSGMDDGSVKIGLSGGRTPLGVFRELAKIPSFDASRVELFWVDERGVPPGHADSNYGAALKSLIEPLKIDKSRVHRMEGELPAEEAARRYDALLALRAPAGLDVAVLGIGEDGHTASLFPGSPALDSPARAAAAVSPKGQPRITMTPAYLNLAPRHLVLVGGAEKAAIAKRALADDPSLPISRVRPRQGSVWVVGRAAASS